MTRVNFSTMNIENRAKYIIQPRILYIEDAKDLCALFKVALDHLGYEITTKMSGKSGINAHFRQPFDVVAIDYQLPDMNGLEIAHQLLQKTPHLITIMITAAGSEEIASQAMNMGISHYVIKNDKQTYLTVIPEIIEKSLRDLKKPDADLQRHKDVVNISSDWVWEMDDQLRFSFFSDGLEKTTGIKAETYLNHKRSDFISDDERDTPHWKKHLSDLENHKEFRNFQYKLVSPTGPQRTVRISGTPIFSNDGTFQGYHGICSDITGNLRSNAEVLNEILTLAVKPQPLKETLESCLDIMLSINWLPILPKIAVFLKVPESDTIYLAAERNMDDNIKSKCKQVKFGHCLCGRAALTQKLVHADCVDHLHEITFDGIEPHGHYNVPITLKGQTIGVFTIYLPDGHKKNEIETDFLMGIADVLSRTIDLKNRETALNDAHNQLELDIQKRTEELQASKTHLTSILDLAPQAMILFDNKMTVKMFNKGAEDCFGYTANEIMGAHISKLIPKSSHKAHEKYTKNFTTSDQNQLHMNDREPVSAMHKNSNTFPAIVSVSKITLGTELHFSVILIDMSKHQQIEAEKNKATIDRQILEQQFKSLIDNSPSAILMKAPDGQYMMSNKKWDSWFNPDGSDITKKTVYDITSKKIADKTVKIDQEVLETGTGKTWEDVMQCVNGTRIPTIYQKFPVYDDQDNIIAIGNINTDISEQKKVEAKLLENDLILRSALNNMAGGIFMVDKKMQILVSSPNFNTYYQLPKGMVKTGKSFLDIIKLRFGRGDYENYYELDVLRKVTKIYQPKKPSTLIETMPNGRIVELALNPLTNGGIVGVFTDISERKKSDKQLHDAMNAVIKATQAKSEFMANMSHELRTPLNAILGFADMISNQYLGPIGNEMYANYAKDIEKSGFHLLALVNDILDIEQIESGNYELFKENFDALELGKEAIKLLKRRAETKSQSLKLLITGELSSIYADHKSILQIVVNLLTNAVKFTDQGGAITLEIHSTPKAHRFIISDNGIGIPADKIAELTNPFSRHEANPHKSQEGVGLGLAICDQLIRLHDGNLEIKSELGKGTSAIVDLPKGI